MSDVFGLIFVLQIVGSVLFVGAFGYKEYLNKIRRPKADRWELMRESGGKFRPTGEILPEGADPHVEAMKRQDLERVSYGARKVRK